MAIRPARQASVISLIIITIGVSIFLRGIAGQLWGRDAVPVPPFSGTESIPFQGVYIFTQSLWVVGVTLVVMLALHFFLSYSVLGKALRACAVNKRAVSLMGIDERKMAAISFSLSAALGAVGGIIIAPLTMTSYDLGVMLGLKGFVAASLGGFSSQLLAAAGGIGLGILEALSAGLISSAYKDATALVVLLVVLFIRAGRLAESERSA